MDDVPRPGGAPTLDGGPAADLEPAGPDPWAHVVVPPGWEPIAEMARTVFLAMEPLADHIVGCVESEVAAYSPGTVPRDDLRASVARNLEMTLLGLAERRGPRPDEVTTRRDLGVRRALQGMPVDAVVQAYLVGYRELWQALVAALPPADPETDRALLTAATTVWEWIHRVSEAISSAHSATVRQLEARVSSARQRLVELLTAGDLDGAEATRLARALGFDPLGSFVVTLVRSAGDDHAAVEVQRRTEALPGRHAVVARGALMVVVSQVSEDEPADGSTIGGLLEAARAVLPGAAAAVGAERDGLRGARASFRDAELTLEVAPDAASASFEDVWLWATLTEAEDRLRGLLAAGAELAHKHAHLAEAVRAFAEGGFSVSEAARTLDVHANTVGYRLDRWHELTGWDPRTFDGLVRSLAAMRLHL